MVFTGYNSPEQQYHYLAYDAALILVVIVMLLLVLSRIIVARSQRHSESARGVVKRRRLRLPWTRPVDEPLLGAGGGAASSLPSKP